MNLDKLTNKTREALVNAQQLAISGKNSEIRNLHVLAALFSQTDGLIPSVLEKLGVNRKLFGDQLTRALAELPKVSDNSSGVYHSGEFSTLLADAAKHAESMQDEYVSVEHLLLAMFNGSGTTAEKLLQGAGITSDKVREKESK